MAIFKCKMCGGTIEFEQGATVGVCQYCGTKQTLPRLDDEKRTQLFDRANYFRRENEFDKAMGIYEMIIADEKEDSEAYWGIVLCKYGIEYVEEPGTHKRIPTVNRAQFTSVFEDADYKKAIQYADILQRDIYEAEAKEIDSIQKGILEISQKEEPFDVFICYKETDDSGNRTQDSVLAQDIYRELTKEGYKVFFSRITLESKLGQQYEPYIFAALNSAKVMLAIGTKPEYFNAVWVKNEWSRFISIMKRNTSKVLIPCYKDISPYDMPDEFTYLQSQDMGKIGFIQDLIHGISKVIKKQEKKVVVSESQTNKAAPLLERAYIFLGNSEWENANQYAEKTLDVEPKNARAYMCKFLSFCKVKSFEELKEKTVKQNHVFKLNSDFFNAKEFADSDYENEIEEFLQCTTEAKYIIACYMMDDNLYKDAAVMFDKLNGYKDSNAKAKQCRQDLSTLESSLYEADKEKRNIKNLNNRRMQVNTENKEAYEKIASCNERIDRANKNIKGSRISLIVSLVYWFMGLFATISYTIGTELLKNIAYVLFIGCIIMYFVFNVFWIIYLKKYSLEYSGKIKRMIALGIILPSIANLVSLINIGGLIDHEYLFIENNQNEIVALNKIVSRTEKEQEGIKKKIADSKSNLEKENTVIKRLSVKKQNAQRLKEF